MTFWTQIALIVVGAALSLMLNWLLLMWFFHWKQREKQPHEEIVQLQKDMIAVRGQLKYIQGLLNGKHWKVQED